MGQHLTAMKISTVSTVDRGANERPFAVLKRAGSAPPVRKAVTFGQLQSSAELSTWLPTAQQALADVVWAALYMTQDGGTPVTVEQRLLAVANSCDEFKAELVLRVGAAIAAQPASVGKRAKSRWAGFV